ncbi:MAG TPA: ornithine cyclodeaminase family protein [Gemmatimonadales bacterium]|nr:ornithine cyclodeaminase family protein [Gemmatimonadales bacterium]
MPVRILNQAEVTTLLPMGECIEAMEAALRSLSAGSAQLPLRIVLRLAEGRGVFGVMPGELRSPPALGLKAIGVFPGNAGTALDSHQGLVLLFDPDTGVPLAVLDASSITAIRTAAVSAVATRAMARSDAGELALLGSGVQARTHLEAMALVRQLRRVRVWSPRAESVRAFTRWARDRLGISVKPAESPREAVSGADLICTVTASRAPVVQGDWLAEGVHINAVGSSSRSARELDTRAVVRGRLVVDRLESAINEAGDFLIPRAEGAITETHIVGELGDVLLGRIEGRTGPAEVTIFKSLGLAIEDLAAAELVLRKAEAGNTGQVVELGGRRDFP